MSADEELVRIGRVVKPHGIRGELVVAAEGESLGDLPLGAAVVVAGEVYAIVGLRPHQGRWLLELEGCDDRTAAEALREAVVEVAKPRLSPLAEDEWYADDLVGWSLMDVEGTSVGIVEAVLPGPMHDYLQVGGDNQLVPMVRRWLVEMDPGLRTIRMKLPAGLLEQDRG